MPDRYDPVTAEQARPIIQAIVYNTLFNWSAHTIRWTEIVYDSRNPETGVPDLENDPGHPEERSITIARLAEKIATALTREVTPGVIDAMLRVRDADA